MDWQLKGKAVSFVSVSDLAAARQFYGQRLGLPLLAEDGHGIFFRHGESLLRITPIPGFEPGPHPVAGWEVPDIREVARGLAAAGVPLVHYEAMGQDPDGIWSAPDGSTHVAWFHDCCGNVLSLSQTGN